jgi:uncharacterized RDD family membrane protein YckC
VTLPARGGETRVYAGLATRTLAFAVDAAVINAAAWAVGIAVALGLSVIGIPTQVRTWIAAIGALLALVWAFAYFVFFWSASGQTPGNRLMRIRVQDSRTGAPPRAVRATLRVAALPLSAIPLCAGFLLILVDGRRRALHDRLVRTVVLEVPEVRRPRHVRARPPDHLVQAAEGAASRTNGSAAQPQRAGRA